MGKIPKKQAVRTRRLSRIFDFIIDKYSRLQ